MSAKRNVKRKTKDVKEIINVADYALKSVLSVRSQSKLHYLADMRLE